MADVPAPAGATYCKVKGSFGSVIADSADADDTPDWVAMTGTAEITANFPFGKDYGAAPRTFFPDKIACIIDADGDLSLNGQKYVMLFAGGTDVLPVGFNYKIKLNLTRPGGAPVQYGPFDFNVIPGEEVDLTIVTAVPATPGVATAKGEKGDPGDTGPMATLAAGTVTQGPLAATITAAGGGYVLDLVIPQGPQGIQGIQGVQGLQGLKGDTGDTGLQGIQGIQGVKGDKGDTGATGAIASLAAGTATQGPLAIDIVGAPGSQVLNVTIPQGPQGIQGIQGIQGETGHNPITVSAVAPVAPLDGDIWFDIS